MCTISVQLDELAALAVELATLAAELDDDAGLCGSAAAFLSAGLEGDEGWASSGAAIAWARLTAVVAARTAAVATTLTAATEAYRASDVALSEGIAGRRWAAVPE